MTIEFRLPDLGEDVDSGEVVEVLVREGDMVEKDQILLELETDKALLEVPSPARGRIAKVHIVAGGELKVDGLIVTIEEIADPSQAEPAEPEPVSEPKPEPVSNPSASEAPERELAKETEPDPPAGEPAPSGVADRPSAKVVEVASAAAVSAAPSIRRLARELGVDLASVRPGGRGGRVTREDVLAYVRSRVAGGGSQPASPGASARAKLPDFSRWGEIERRPLSRIRKHTIESMALSWARIPHVTQNDEADLTDLMALRTRHAKQAAERGGKLTVTVFVIKAVVAALKAYPRINSSLDLEAKELILKRYYHIGVAVDTEHGLLVPVMRDVDKKHLIDLSAELAVLSDRARRRKVKLEEMRGATFTITNLGGIGGTSFSPIIHYPEVAILGLARSQKRLVMNPDGEIEQRLFLPLCLSYDHRIVDGAEAVRFTRKVAEMLEDPALLLLES